MKQDNKKWLINYAFPCFTPERDSLDKLPHIKDIEEFLQGDYSLEKVRDYFFIPHNMRTIKDSKKDQYQFHHLVIPYSVWEFNNDQVSGVLSEPFYDELQIPLCNRSFNRQSIDLAKTKGILNEEIVPGEIIITHALTIVDHCKKEDLQKYNNLYK